jgi:sRNA-binding protein
MTRGSRMVKFSEEKVNRILAFAAILAEKHPLAFPSQRPGNSAVVLKIGIHRDMSALYPEMSRRTLSGFMSWHTRSSKYLEASSVVGAARHDLDGNVAGHVTDDQANAANELLAERKAQFAVHRAKARASKTAASEPSLS